MISTLVMAIGLIVSQTNEASPPLRIGGTIPGPKRVKFVAPKYDDRARRAGFGGPVVVECEVSPDGRVSSTKVVRGIPLLNDRAVEAVRQWRYEPLLLNGEPVRIVMTVTVNFASSVPPPDVGTVMKLLKEHDAELRAYTAAVVGAKAYRFQAADKGKLKKLLETLASSDENEAVRREAHRALAELSK